MSLATVPVLALVFLATVVVCQAGAVPYVFFQPGSVAVPPGESVEISFRVGACQDSISGYQLYVSFDPTVVELVSATEGSLYVYSGYSTWFIPEELGPGSWHFFDTVMGTGTYILPPGELLHLEFQTLGYGSTEIHIDSILLADVRRNNLPVGGYEHGSIFVVPLTGIEEGGIIARIGPAMPNPFRSATALPYSAPVCGVRDIEIYDVAGRLVRRINIPTSSPDGEIVWDGRDESGEEVPSSVYFVRLAGGTSSAHCRVVKTE